VWFDKWRGDEVFVCVFFLSSSSTVSNETCCEARAVETGCVSLKWFYISERKKKGEINQTSAVKGERR
jgi:hypothetical protein